MNRDVEYATLCQLVYEDGIAPDIRGEKEGAFAKIIPGSNGLPTLVFRGSKTPQDWFNDLQALPRKDPILGYVHSGFSLMVDEVLPQIQDKFPSKRLNIGGHSLGGGEAILTAVKLSQMGYTIGRVVTFGAPRAGSWRLWRLSYGLDITQYRFGTDPVPEVPKGFWYMHMRSLTKIGTPCTGLDPFECHHIEQYIKGLT